MTGKKDMSPVERMKRGKSSLIKRLKNEINAVREDAAEEVRGIESRIRIAQSILDALEKGTLKP